MEKTNKFHILINKNSGTVLNTGAKNIEAMIADSGLPLASLHFLPAQELFDKIKEFENDNTPLLIGGGDGTINSVAQIIVKQNKSFGILPMGTMNLLAKDLDIPADLKEAIKAYSATGKTIKIDMAKVNGQGFLCSAAVGTIPETSEFREENRTQSTPLLFPRVTKYFWDHLDPKYRRRYKLLMNGRSKKIKSASIVVSNNQYGRATTWNAPSLKRQSLQDGKLGIYSAAPAHAWDKLRLLLRLGLGGWNDDPIVKEWIARELEIRTGDEDELVSLDGETVRLRAPLKFTIDEKALKILVPGRG